MFSFGRSNTVKQAPPNKPPLQHPPPKSVQYHSQIQSSMSAAPDNRFSLASATTISTNRSSIFSTVNGDYSRRSSASTLQSIHPSQDEVALESAFQHKLQYEKSVQEKEFRMVQAHFISQVLAYMGYNEHAIVGSTAMALHGVDTSIRSPLKSAGSSFGVGLVNVPHSIDILLEISGVGSAALGSVHSTTVGKLTHSLKRMFVDKLPVWFYLDEDSPVGRLFFQDTTDMLTATVAAAAQSEDGENHFMEAIKVAAENLPSPPPKDDVDVGGEYALPKVSLPSVDEYTRRPIEISIHIAAHPESPYRWLRSISLSNNAKGNAITTVITHKHCDQSTANLLALQTPSVTLPTLLILTLCNSGYHLRSLKMDDRKKGQEEMRQAVTLSKRMQSNSIRVPASMDIPEEAIRMLERFRGPKGVEEKDLLTWVLRSNKGRRGLNIQLSVEIPKNTAYVPGMNKELRDLTLVKRATIGAPVVSGVGPASRSSQYLSPVSVYTGSRPMSMVIHSPSFPPVDAFAMAANSSNRGVSSKGTSSRGSSIMEGVDGSDRASIDYMCQRLDVPGVYRRDLEVQSVNEVHFQEKNGQHGEKDEKRKTWFAGLGAGIAKSRWSIGPRDAS